MSEDVRSQAQFELRVEPNQDALAALEALLFTAGDAVSINDLAKVLDWSPGDVRRHLDLLEQEYVTHRRGLALQRGGDEVQLMTAPRLGPLVSRWLSIERTMRLSEAALETLAIVAYRQPMTRAEVEAVRGVDSSGVLSTLLARELIQISGQRQGPGNPNEYCTTDTFLRHFGIQRLTELPGWDDDVEQQAAADD